MLVEEEGKKGPTVTPYNSSIICNYDFFQKSHLAQAMHPIVLQIVRKIGKIFQMVGHMTITTERHKPLITRRWIQARMRWSI